MKAREIAFKILCDIEENNNYSNIAINKHFKNISLSNQDRGLATEIVYGVIENKYYLDYIIDKLSKIKTQKLSLYVKILLRIGIYQIAFLNSISDYAAVNETVNLIKNAVYQLPETIPPDIQSLISKIFVINPEQRYSLEDVMESSFVLSDVVLPLTFVKANTCSLKSCLIILIEVENV